MIRDAASAPKTAPEIDVSVIVPAWKAANLIERSVASALASTGVALEVIVVDDASPDGTFSAAQTLAAADPRVIAERLATNGGPSAARNRAITLARGRYIAVLDADDAMDPARLRSLVDVADRTDSDIVVDNMIEVDEAGDPIVAGASLTARFLKSDAFATARQIDLETWVRFNMPMHRGDCLGYLKPLFRRSTLERSGIRYDESLRNSEDYYVVAHLLASGARMTYTPEAGYRYTRSSGSTSHRLMPQQTRAWLAAEADFRVRRLPALARAEVMALEKRGQTLREVDQFVRTIDTAKSGRPAAIARALASDLGAAPFTVVTLAKIVLGKITRRKLV